MSLFGPGAPPAAQIVAPGGFAAFGIQASQQPLSQTSTIGGIAHYTDIFNNIF